MGEIKIVERKLTAGQLLELRESVGWPGRSETGMQAGLDGTLYGVCAMRGDDIVGVARVAGDGRTVFYIQDVIVRPGHQRQGIGRAMMERVMEYIGAHACHGAAVWLMAALGKEPFYRKFGFRSRPDGTEGAVMIQLWTM